MKYLWRHWIWRGVFVLAAMQCGSAPVGAEEREGESFWAFRPVRAVKVPEVPWPSAALVSSPIDRFIGAQLAARGLRPAPPAERRTLLRRVTYDLTGLPPTPQELADFLADDSPAAFSRVVDRLLASPRYGERWGRHWLDVVRYADARDLIQLPAESDFREAWRYRDWVIRAFNRDLPYDQFLTLQIAGDLLQPQGDPSRIDADALVATGFLALADFVPGDVDKEQMIADYVNDQIDVIGRACLGLTLACARCHDHKFDPISTADYYSLAGIFFSTRLIPGPVKGNTPLVRVPLLPPAEIAALEAGQVRDKLRMAELSREIEGAGDREYRDWLGQQVLAQSESYLLAGWDFLQLRAGNATADSREFAEQRRLEPEVLAHWLAVLQAPLPHPALRPLRDALDQDGANTAVRQLLASLAKVADQVRAEQERDPTAAHVAAALRYRFQSDDRRFRLRNEGEISGWPNRGLGPVEAMAVTDVPPPKLVEGTVAGGPRSVLQFTGRELLQAAGPVPPSGSLLVAFRPRLDGPAGQRLIGWEDAAAGQHGLGLMTDAAGAVHVIARRNGANGDVVVPAVPPGEVSEFQILCVSWGPDGVAVFRNGQPAGSNRGIDSISSDPAIPALRIGGPGSGASPFFQGELGELRVYTLPLPDDVRSRVTGELTQRWRPGNGEPSMLDDAADLYVELTSASSPFRLEGPAREKVLPQDHQRRLVALREELSALQKKPAVEIPRAVVVLDGGPPDTPHAGFHDARIYLRGNHAKPGEIVPRGVPRVLAGDAPFLVHEGSGRRELARWLIDPRNPLTARVLVNRVWQHHFGAGLVRTSTNFGMLGERPSHPELLDYLAARFVESGWSIKALHRLMLLTQVYQQSSAAHPEGLAADPENRLFWRAQRRRLEAEALRDALLAIAGRLDDQAGGPAFQDVAASRRSVYQMSTRTGSRTVEFSALFDAPDCSGIVERRNESIVAPQALLLMNDPLITDLAGALAARIERDVPLGTVTDRINRLYELALGRLPGADELDIGVRFLASEKDGGEPALPAWARYCRLIVWTNEFLYID